MHFYRRIGRIQYALGLYFVAFGGLVRALGPVTSIPPCTSPLTPAPCPLLESVMSTCAEADGQNFVLLSLVSEPLGQYPGPVANTSAVQKCQCTDVGYNLYSACAACQVGDDNTHWESRDMWFSGCTANSDQTQIAVAPPGVPSENITLWMTQQYIPTFSPSEALAVLTNDTLPTTPVTSATQTVPTNSANPSGPVKGGAGSSINSSGSTTNKTGIIVGAMVGAFALLAIIALGIIFCIRRRRRRERRSRRDLIIS